MKQASIDKINFICESGKKLTRKEKLYLFKMMNRPDCLMILWTKIVNALLRNSLDD